MKRYGVFLFVLLTLFSGVAVSVTLGAHPAQALAASNRPQDYLALGNSVAFGYSPLADPRNADNFIGYPNPVATALKETLTNAVLPRRDEQPLHLSHRLRQRLRVMALYLLPPPRDLQHPRRPTRICRRIPPVASQDPGGQHRHRCQRPLRTGIWVRRSDYPSEIHCILDGLAWHAGDALSQPRHHLWAHSQPGWLPPQARRADLLLAQLQ